MTKITFEEWKKDYEDIPYIKQNYKKSMKNMAFQKNA